jgi:hypothetical protein
MSKYKVSHNQFTNLDPRAINELIVPTTEDDCSISIDKSTGDWPHVGNKAKYLYCFQ